MAHDALMPVEPAPRRWPLAAVVWIDLVLIVALILLGTLIAQRVILGINLQALGLSITDFQAMSQSERLGIIGVRGAFVSTLIQNAICIAIPLIRIRLIRREPAASIGFSMANWPVNIAIGFGVGAIAIGLNIALGLLFRFVFGIEQDQLAQLTALLRPNNLLGQVLFAVLTIIVAPIGEETLFRGYIFNAIRQNNGMLGLVLAYGISAGMFAVVHLLNVTQGQIALVLPIFVLGLLLAGAMHLTKSLVPCIVAHATMNSLATFALLFCVNTQLPGCPV